MREVKELPSYTKEQEKQILFHLKNFSDAQVDAEIAKKKASKKQKKSCTIL
jgi:hypothetical protein